MGSASKQAADVLVIGAGIVGMSVADEVSRRGRSVRVLERRAPGAEASWAAGGMLAADYESEAPGRFADLMATSRSLWPDYAARLGEAWGHEVGLRREGTLAIAFDEAQYATLRSRLDWLAAARRRAQWLSAKEARELEPRLAPGLAGAALLPDDAVVNNRAVLLALAASLRERGVEVVSHAEATLLVEGGTVRGALADGVRYDATVVVNAAGAWASQVTGDAARALPRFVPVRGQMAQVLRPEDALPRPVRWEGGYAIPRGNRVVIGSTMEPVEDFDRRVTPEALTALMAALRRALPSLAEHPATHAWAGLRPKSADGLPVIGRAAALPGLVYAAGLFRNGILLTPAVALAVADLIDGKTPDFDITAFDPARPALAGGGSILVNGATRAIPPAATVGALLSELSLKKQGIAVALNAEVVRRGDWDATPLKDRDRVEIIHAVGGG